MKATTVRLEDVLRDIEPARRASVLEPFGSSLVSLHEAGYTYEQLRTALAGAGVEISRQGIQQYVQRRIKREAGTNPTPRPPRSASSPPPAPTAAAGAVPAAHPGESIPAQVSATSSRYSIAPADQNPASQRLEELINQSTKKQPLLG